jgi:hypothetical protein
VVCTRGKSLSISAPLHISIWAGRHQAAQVVRELGRTCNGEFSDGLDQLVQQERAHGRRVLVLGEERLVVVGPNRMAHLCVNEDEETSSRC